MPPDPPVKDTDQHHNQHNHPLPQSEPCDLLRRDKGGNQGQNGQEQKNAVEAAGFVVLDLGKKPLHRFRQILLHVPDAQLAAKDLEDLAWLQLGGKLVDQKIGSHLGILLMERTDLFHILADDAAAILKIHQRRLLQQDDLQHIGVDVYHRQHHTVVDSAGFPGNHHEAVGRHAADGAPRSPAVIEAALQLLPAEGFRRAGQIVFNVQILIDQLGQFPVLQCVIRFQDFGQPVAAAAPVDKHSLIQAPLDFPALRVPRFFPGKGPGQKVGDDAADVIHPEGFPIPVLPDLGFAAAKRHRFRHLRMIFRVKGHGDMAKALIAAVDDADCIFIVIFLACGQVCPEGQHAKPRLQQLQVDPLHREFRDLRKFRGKPLIGKCHPDGHGRRHVQPVVLAP